jgi:hypothetical protein
MKAFVLHLHEIAGYFLRAPSTVHRKVLNHHENRFRQCLHARTKIPVMSYHSSLIRYFLVVVEAVEGFADEHALFTGKVTVAGCALEAI